MYCQFRLSTILFILLIACNTSATNEKIDEKKQDREIIVLDPDVPSNLDSIQKIFQGVSYLQLEQTEIPVNELFVSIYFFEKYILFLDIMPYPSPGDAQVLLYRNDGKLIRKIGNFGNAKGEYSSIRDARFNPHFRRLELLTEKPSRILSYDLDSGKFIEEIQLNPSFPYNKFFPLDRQYYLFSNYQYDNNGEDMDYHFFLIERNTGIIEKKWASFSKSETSQLMLNSRLDLFPISPNQILSSYYNWPFIYTISSQGVKKSYLFKFKNYDFNSDLSHKGGVEMGDREVCCLGPMIITSNFIWGHYKLGNTFRSKNFFYHQNMKKLFQFDMDRLHNSLSGAFLGMPIGYTTDKICFSVNPEGLIRIYKSNKNKLIPEYRQQLESFISDMDENGGLILIMYHIKDE